MENYKIYIETSIIGTKLSLDKTNIGDKKYNRWAVEDDFNGLSLPSMIYDKEKTNGRIGEYIYGFYKVNSTVTLKLYGKNGKEEASINNVTIIERR